MIIPRDVRYPRSPIEIEIFLLRITETSLRQRDTDNVKNWRCSKPCSRRRQQRERRDLWNWTQSQGSVSRPRLKDHLEYVRIISEPGWTPEARRYARS